MLKTMYSADFLNPGRWWWVWTCKAVPAQPSEKRDSKSHTVLNCNCAWSREIKSAAHIYYPYVAYLQLRTCWSCALCRAAPRSHIRTWTTTSRSYYSSHKCLATSLLSLFYIFLLYLNVNLSSCIRNYETLISLLVQVCSPSHSTMFKSKWQP